MRIIAYKTIKQFWQYSNHRDSEQPLRAWYYEVKQATWRSPHDIKTKYKRASILKNNRVIFNIAGNKYRLIVKIQYDLRRVFIRFIGTHDEYDKIKAETI